MQKRESVKAMRLSARSRRQAGSSLLETVIAFFVLAGAMIVSVTLFHRAIQWQSHVELRATALFLARTRLEEVRVAARALTAFQDGLSAEVGTTVSNSEPELEVAVRVNDLSSGDRQRFIPSQSGEEVFAAAPPPVHGSVPDVFGGLVTDDRKRLAASFLCVDVVVTSRRNRIPATELTAYLSEPARKGPPTVRVSEPSANAITFRESARFTAEVVDADGNPIPDAQIRWTVAPISGYGKAYQSRDGRVGSLCYVAFDSGGNPVQPPAGQCRLRATVRIDGEIAFGLSDPVELLP